MEQEQLKINPQLLISDNKEKNQDNNKKKREESDE